LITLLPPPTLALRVVEVLSAQVSGSVIVYSVHFPGHASFAFGKEFIIGDVLYDIHLPFQGVFPVDMPAQLMIAAEPRGILDALAAVHARVRRTDVLYRVFIHWAAILLFLLLP
jgi:hypothetical protein